MSLINLNIFDAYISNSFLEDRIYFNTSNQILSPEEIKKSITYKEKVFNNQIELEYKGAGVRSYGKRWGAILAVFGISVKIHLKNGEDVYVNTNSLAKYAIRRILLDDGDKKTLTTLANHIHYLYQIEKKHGILSLEYINESAYGAKKKIDADDCDTINIFKERIDDLKNDIFLKIFNEYKQNGIVDLSK